MIPAALFCAPIVAVWVARQWLSIVEVLPFVAVSWCVYAVIALTEEP